MNVMKEKGKTKKEKRQSVMLRSFFLFPFSFFLAPLLAAGDPLQIINTVISAIALMFTILLGFLFHSLNNRQRKIERMEDDLKTSAQQHFRAEMATMEKGTESKLGGMLQQMDTKISTTLQSVQERLIEDKVRIGQIEQRLLAGDSHMKRLDGETHKLEVEVLKQIGELKDIVATKDDLNRLREEVQRGNR